MDDRNWDDPYAGDAPPPWDIGRPQPQFEAVARAGGLHGRVLDGGCGTGEHTLLAASHGADAIGIDLSARAIQQARQKATVRGVAARFEVGDMLTLAAPQEPFDVILDCGVFHVFDDTDRQKYVGALRRQLRPGGTVYLLCFSDRQPGEWGPRRIRESELHAAFTDGWRVDVAPVTLTVNPVDQVTEVQAWFATIRRIS